MEGREGQVCQHRMGTMYFSSSTGAMMIDAGIAEAVPDRIRRFIDNRDHTARVPGRWLQAWGPLLAQRLVLRSTGKKIAEAVPDRIRRFIDNRDHTARVPGRWLGLGAALGPMADSPPSSGVPSSAWNAVASEGDGWGWARSWLVLPLRPSLRLGPRCAGPPGFSTNIMWRGIPVQTTKVSSIIEIPTLVLGTLSRAENPCMIKVILHRSIFQKFMYKMLF